MALTALAAPPCDGVYLPHPHSMLFYPNYDPVCDPALLWGQSAALSPIPGFGDGFDLPVTDAPSTPLKDTGDVINPCLASGDDDVLVYTDAPYSPVNPLGEDDGDDPPVPSTSSVPPITDEGGGAPRNEVLSLPYALADAGLDLFCDSETIVNILDRDTPEKKEYALAAFVALVSGLRSDFSRPAGAPDLTNGGGCCWVVAALWPSSRLVTRGDICVRSAMCRTNLCRLKCVDGNALCLEHKEMATSPEGKLRLLDAVRKMSSVAYRGVITAMFVQMLMTNGNIHSNTNPVKTPTVSKSGKWLEDHLKKLVEWEKRLTKPDEKDDTDEEDENNKVLVGTAVRFTKTIINITKSCASVELNKVLRNIMGGVVHQNIAGIGLSVPQKVRKSREPAKGAPRKRTRRTKRTHDDQ